MSRILIDGRPLGVGGGVQTYARNLTRALLSLELEHELILAVPDASLAAEFEAAEVATLRCPRILWEQVALPLLARRTRADVIHATKHIGPLWAPCPVVVTIHDAMFFTFPELWRPGEGPYWRMFTRLSASRCAHIITVSHCARRDLLQLGIGGGEKITTVYSAASRDFKVLENPTLVQQVAAKYQLRPPVILTVGTRGRKKNIATLIRAMPLLQRHLGCPPLLLIVGRPFQKDPALDQALGECGPDLVRFTGWVPLDELVALYNAADVFAFASVYEGFGLPPLEAMQCGLPVVSTQEGSIAEVLAEAVLTVDDPYDAREFADKLAAVLSDAALARRLSEAGLAQASKFSWRKTAEQTLDVYNAVLRTGAGRAA